MFRRLLAGSLIAFGCLAGPAHASLVMYVDTAAKEFWFSGSDSGLLAYDGGQNDVAWATGNPSGAYGQVGGFETLFDFSPAVTFQDDYLLVFDNDVTLLLLSVVQQSWNTSDALGITGNGSHLSYASLTAARQAIFESTVGQSPIAPFLGSGWSPVSVVDATPVPEPSSLALVGAGGLLFALRRRARAKSRPRTQHG